MKFKDEEILDKVKHLIIGDELAGKAMDAGCTDGYDTHYVLLATAIIYAVREHDKKTGNEK